MVVWHKQANINTVKQPDSFRHWITADGSSGFKAEPDRYHLYISLACPWACRTLIFRKLKKLENIISISIVDPLMGENGWEFSNNQDCIPDKIKSLSLFTSNLYHS